MDHIRHGSSGTLEHHHHLNNHHHHHHGIPTPGEIIRKLSHSKIIVHMPSILGDHKSGGCDEEKEGVVELISIEEPEGEDNPISSFPEEDEYDEEDLPPEIKIKYPAQNNTAGAEGKWKLVGRLPCAKYLGLILALISSILISLVTLIVKSLSQYHPLSLVIWRLQGILLPSIIIMAYSGRRTNLAEPFWPLSSWSKWGILILLVVRGFTGSTSDIFQYYSLQYLSLADSSVISYSSPVFVTFVAYFVLGESIGIVSVFTGLMSLIGVIIISRPPILTGEESFDSNILIGNGLALGSMIMATVTFIILRILRNVHFSLSISSFGFFGTIEALLMCWTLSTFSFPQGTTDWILAVTIGLLYFVGNMCFTLALQLEDAGPVSLTRSCDVIFAYIWQFLFLNVVPDVFSVIGGCIVISAVFLTALRKWLSELPEKDNRRETLWFLLR